MPLTFQRNQHVHFVGIGGVGLSAIARILLARGVLVSGSDRQANALTMQLAALGARVQIGHAAENAQGAELLVVSSAIDPANPEIAYAQAHGIPVYKRSQMIDALTRDKACIAIAGTHGKTTTTAMTVHVLRENGRDPSYIVGGVLANTGDNAGDGAGATFVIEADEYDNMFHGLHPQTAVITSVEHDHPDFFATPEALRASFAQFIAQVDTNGRVVVCADDAHALALAATHPHVLRYGTGENANYRVVDLRYTPDGMTFALTQPDAPSVPFALQVYGTHNALNAAAAALASQPYGVTLADAARALASFRGTGRRFEVRQDKGGVAIVDDYAHHPTAIATTLQAARARYPERALWAVWQPHTYSRTRALWNAYLRAFDNAQHVLVTDVYAAREAYDPSVDMGAFVREMAHADAHYTPTLDDALAHLRAHVRAPAAILVMSAGDAVNLTTRYIQQNE